MKKTKILLFTLLIGLLIFSALPVLAAENEVECAKWLGTIGVGSSPNDPDGCIIPENCLKSPAGSIGECGLTQIFQMIVNVSQLILAMTGSAALLMFAIGGVMWIISAGNQEKIQKGKAAITAAAIGIAIILGAWLIVNTTILVLTKGQAGSIAPATLFGQQWYKEQQVEQNQP